MDRISTDDILRSKRPASQPKKKKKKIISGRYYKAPERVPDKKNTPSYKGESKRKVSSKSKSNHLVALLKERWDVFTNKCLTFDMPLFIIVTLLLIIGLIMMYSASYAYAYYNLSDSMYYIKRQMLFAFFGVIGMLFVSTISPTKFKGVVTYATLGISYVLLVIVLFLPKVQGVRRWINLGFTTFQPSEIAKFAVILWCANYIADHYKQMNMVHYSSEAAKLKANRSKVSSEIYAHWYNFQYAVLPFGVILGPMLVLLLLEPHLSCTVLVVCIIATMMYIGGTKKSYFLFLGLLGVIGFMLVVYTNIVPYGQTRINVWKDPFVDKLGSGWQNIQSLYAISSGGLFGVGLGNSRQKYLYISEPQNDFIFAVICEELGFIGAAFIILLFMLFVYRGLVISIANPDKFSRIVGIGITSQIGFQALLNVCVVTKIVPNTGISLPFFSSGGTSLMMLLMEIGVLLAISRKSPNKIG